MAVEKFGPVAVEVAAGAVLKAILMVPDLVLVGVAEDRAVLAELPRADQEETKAFFAVLRLVYRHILRMELQEVMVQ
jgi:hypothetical protein